MKRRVNEIFDECIEAIKNNEKTVEECLSKYGKISPEFEAMLKASVKLIEAAKFTPTAERKQQARAKLLEAVEKKRWELGIEGNRIGRHAAKAPRWRAVLLRVGIGAVAIAMLSGTTVALAQGSLPGSPLYPVKIAVEKARIGLTMDKAKKGELYLGAAKERISELKKLKQNDSYRQDLLNATAEDIGLADKAFDGSHSKEFEEALDGMAQKNREVLEDVLEKVPPSAKPALQRALINATGDESQKSEGQKKDIGNGNGNGSQGKNGSENYDKAPTTNSSNKPGSFEKGNVKERAPSIFTPTTTLGPSNYGQEKHENSSPEQNNRKSTLLSTDTSRGFSHGLINTIMSLLGSDHGVFETIAKTGLLGK